MLTAFVKTSPQLKIFVGRSQMEIDAGVATCCRELSRENMIEQNQSVVDDDPH